MISQNWRFARARKTIATSRAAILGLAASFALLTTSTFAATINEANFASASQLKQWQSAADNFDQGYRPTGSPAHLAYTAWLAQAFRDVGTSVSLEPYSFQKWTPTSWSLQMLNGPHPGAVQIANYIPWSGQTNSAGFVADMVYVPSVTAAIISWANGQGNFMESPDKQNAAKLALKAQLTQLINASGVAGKTVVIDLPKIGLPYALFAPLTYYKNDPDGAFGPGAALGKNGSLSDILIVPVLQELLALSGAKGMVAVLDFPEKMARGAYYPFLGIQLVNLPGLFVDRETGKILKSSIAANGGAVSTKLVLDATFNNAVDNNVIGVVDAPIYMPEIVVSSHTDGTNSIEDNGPAAMLAMASYFAKMPYFQRPAKFRFVNTGGHFVQSLGIRAYLQRHFVDLRFSRAILEIEHLGALEWDEISSGIMGLTGKAEPQQIMINAYGVPITGTDSAQAQALLNRSVDFSKKSPRSIVLGPVPAGEGLWWHYPVAALAPATPLPSIQFITNPSYLLSSRIPEITSQFTDYNLMRNQAIGLTQMAVDLAGNRFW